MSGQSPLVATFSMVIPATAQAVDFVATICKAPFAGTLTAASYVPDTDITGADTNTRTLNIHNRKQDGDAGTDVVMATITFDSGEDGVAYDEKALTLSVVSGATTVAADDVITFESLHVASGLADPGGTVFLELTRS